MTTEKRKKRSMTLIEIMIVMFLVTLIAGAIGYNVLGALEKGKAFKTHQNMSKIENVILLKTAEDPDIWEDLQSNPDLWKDIVKKSPLVKNPTDVLRDGWGVPFRIEVNEAEQKIEIQSKKFKEYLDKNPGSFKE